MTRAIVTGLLVAILALSSTSKRPAQGADDAPKAFVVLVGIDEYGDAAIKPRKHAEGDAKALYDLFSNKKYVDIDADQVKLLLGKKDDKRPSQLATKENIAKAVHWAVAHAGPNDLLFFAFIGQGAPVGDRSCFFGVDSTFKDRAKNAYLAADLEQEMTKLKSQRFCALIDVYFKGWDNKDKEKVTEPNPMDLYKIFLGNDDKEDHTPPPGRVVLLATNGLKQSLDLPKNGLFTHAVLEALQGAADKEGYEPDGLVTMDELVTFLEKQVPELARTHGKSREEKEQLHHTLGARENHFVLTHNPAVYPKTQERLEKFSTIAKGKGLAGEVGDEGKRLLARMPKLQAQQDLRKDYQKLVDGTLTVDEFLKDRERIYAAAKLRRSDAVAYATKVMQACAKVRDEYVKPLALPQMVAWSVEGLYTRIGEKKNMPPDVKEKLANIKELKDADLVNFLADVREKLGKREDLANDKDVDIALQTMMSHLDPYSTFIDKEMLAQFKRETHGNFTGIGVQIRKDATRDQLLVVTPLRGSPAYRAGIKTGDVVTTIIREMDSEGKKLPKPEVVPTKGLPLSDAVSKILGEPGTDVKLVIERDGVKEPLEFKITRGRVEIETVLGFKRKDSDDWDLVIDPDNRIVYARLTQFARNTFRDMRDALAELDRKVGIKGLVLDLRFNPGGLLPSAVDISDLFIDDGAIVSIRQRSRPEETYTGERTGSMLSFPMVCLVNGSSASGSEIVAACLQDHGRAVIMGERSYGKGSVQNIMPFKPTGGEIKLTTATFWRPSGKNLNKSSTKGTEDEDWGVLPDKAYLLKLEAKERDQLIEHMRDQEIIARRDAPTKEAKPPFKDRQLEMALDYLRGQIKTASKVQNKKAG